MHWMYRMFSAVLHVLMCWHISAALDSTRNIRVAIKKLARPFQSAIHAKRTYRELRLLKHMNHENVLNFLYNELFDWFKHLMSHQVIGLLDVFTPSTTLDDFQDVYLVTHLMGADLNSIIKTQRLSDDHVQFLVYQILRGLKYIHSAGIIHRVSVFATFLSINHTLSQILAIFKSLKNLSK